MQGAHACFFQATASKIFCDQGATAICVAVVETPVPVWMNEARKLVAALAAFLPALRAAKIDPNIALRCE